MVRTAYFIQLDHVGMSHFLQNFNFSRDPLDVLLVVYFILLQDFHSYLPITGGLTFSPVSTCVPCLTCPNVPLPSALPAQSTISYLRHSDQL